MSEFAHIEIAESCAAKLRVLSGLLVSAATKAAMKPGDEQLANRVSEILGDIHSVGENAMNDYRVNRKVAKVERLWRERFDTVASGG